MRKFKALWNKLKVWTQSFSADQPVTWENIGKVAVVLGAGNQSFLTIFDMLDNIFHCRRVVLVKHHLLHILGSLLPMESF